MEAGGRKKPYKLPDRNNKRFRLRGHRGGGGGSGGGGSGGGGGCRGKGRGYRGKNADF